MPFSLIPKLILPSLTDLTPELLAARGVRFLMLDFDNTIVPYTTNEPAEASHMRKSRSSAAFAHVSRDSRSTRRRAPSRATRSTRTSSARTARG